MHGDSVKPCREPAAALKARQRAPRRNERFLRAVLRRLPLSREAQAQSINPRRELPIQTLECRRIAGSCRGNRIRRLSAGIHGENSVQSVNHSQLGGRPKPEGLNVKVSIAQAEPGPLNSPAM